IGLISAAGGVAVLAHPGAVSRGWRIPDEAIAGLAAAGLAGLEVFHPDHDEAERSRLAALAARLHLVPSGGSDAHDRLNRLRIGLVRGPAAPYELLSALRGPGRR